MEDLSTNSTPKVNLQPLLNLPSSLSPRLQYMALSHIRLIHPPSPASQLHRPPPLGLSGASACLPMTFWLQASSQLQLTLWLTPLLSQSTGANYCLSDREHLIPSTLFKHDLAWCSPSCFPHNKPLRAHTCLSHLGSNLHPATLLCLHTC